MVFVLELLSLRFGKIAVGTVDGVGAAVGAPVPNLTNFSPLCFGTIIDDFDKVIATGEHTRTKFSHPTGDCHTGEAGAIPERITANAGDAVGDGDAGKAGAAIERIIANDGDAITDGQAGKAGATSERSVGNAGDAIRDCHAGEALALIKRIIANAGDAIGHGDTKNAGAFSE